MRYQTALRPDAGNLYLFRFSNAAPQEANQAAAMNDGELPRKPHPWRS
jgi:hypothetical protein